MDKSKRMLSLLVFCLLVNMLTGQSGFPIIVGASEKVITPLDTAYIAGHAQNRHFKGVHDPLYVKAMIVTHPTDTFALLSFDCIGLLYPQLLDIREAFHKVIPEFPSSQVAMTSTHTHSGPDVVGIWGPDLMHSGVDPDYLNYLTDAAVNCLSEAWENRRAASIQYASTTFGREWVYNISEPEELDRSVTILRILDNQGMNIITLTNFACHPTFLDGSNDQVSSDYVGGYYERMNKVQGGINMFLQGSIGGWVQPEYEENTFSQAYTRGHQLADLVIMSLESSKAIEETRLIYKSERINLKVENSNFMLLSQMGIIDREMTDSVGTEIVYFEIGEASFATHPGETVPDMGLRTKAIMDTDGPKFVIGLGMDALGYILKPSFFNPDNQIPHSSYLCSMSLGIQTQEYLIENIRKLIKK